jgi:hypothetical protein
MGAPYTGRCFCESVQYRINEAPLTVYACHCTDCQKRSGSAFGLSLWVNRAAIEVTQGDAVLLASTGHDERPRHARACAKCHTRLWSEPQKNPRLAVVRPGTLDDTSWLAPVAHIWTRSAQKWVEIPEGVARYETQPADMMELVKLWRDTHAHSPLSR